MKEKTPLRRMIVLDIVIFLFLIICYIGVIVTELLIVYFAVLEDNLFIIPILLRYITCVLLAGLMVSVLFTVIVAINERIKRKANIISYVISVIVALSAICCAVIIGVQYEYTELNSDDKQIVQSSENTLFSSYIDELSKADKVYETESAVHKSGVLNDRYVYAYKSCLGLPYKSEKYKDENDFASLDCSIYYLKSKSFTLIHSLVTPESLDGGFEIKEYNGIRYSVKSGSSQVDPSFTDYTYIIEDNDCRYIVDCSFESCSSLNNEEITKEVFRVFDLLKE